MNVRGHQFVEISYHTPSNCDVCNKTLPWSINIIRKGEVSYECKRESVPCCSQVHQDISSVHACEDCVSHLACLPPPPPPPHENV